LKKAGVAPVVPDEKLTSRGLVQSFEDAAKTSALFRSEGVAGVVIGAVNFGNELPAAVTAVEGAPGAPILLFGCTEEGELTYNGARRDSLCGTLSIATALRQRLAKYSFPQVANCPPDDPALIAEFKKFASVCKTVSGVRGSVYGQIGPRPAEFETCAFDELSLLRKFGIRTVPIPLSEVFGLATSLDKPEAVAETVASLKKLYDVEGISQAILERLARLDIVLCDLIDTHGFAAMALQCWNSIQLDYGVSACSIMARINQLKNIPVACEVDIIGALSMQMLALASGNTPILMDWNNRHFKEKDVFSAWHCGVIPAGICEGACKLRPNKIQADIQGSAEKVTGVLDGTLKRGPVTMARVTETPEGGWKLLIVEGEAEPHAGTPPGGNAWVRVSDFDKLYRALLRDFPHHGALVHGHVGAILADAAHFLGLEVVAPLPVKGLE